VPRQEGKYLVRIFCASFMLPSISVKRKVTVPELMGGISEVSNIKNQEPEKSTIKLLPK
jgi:hypothetical protein